MASVSGIPEMQADPLERADDVVTGTSTRQSMSKIYTIENIFS
jgi:hypothetical protein